MSKNNVAQYFVMSFIFAPFVIVALLYIVGLAEFNTPETVEAYEIPFMRIVEDGETAPNSSIKYKILVDEETGVMYYAEYIVGINAFNNYQYQGLSIIPLYNTDGTLRIYEGD